MHARLALLAFLAALPAAAQKPWEMRLDLAVPLPVELPAIPSANPFAVAMTTSPSLVTSPLLGKVVSTFPVQAAAYVDATGACRRAVVVQSSLPGLAAELQTALTETTFATPKSSGAAATTWLPVSFDLKGRIDEGRLMSVSSQTPDPTAPPVADEATAPPVDARDLTMPAVAVETLDQLPVPKHFKARLDGRSWRQVVRFLVEISREGKATRVVFLSCPEGLRTWVLRSMTAWVFRPGQTDAETVVSWLQVEMSVQVTISDLASDTLRLTRQTVYPRAAAAPGVALLPGG